MALSPISCEKAIIIFEGLCYIKSQAIVQGDEKNQFLEGYVIGIDKKEDGGWESLFINLKNMSDKQLALWEKTKKSIPNSSSLHEVKPGITRIGFY